MVGWLVGSFVGCGVVFVRSFVCWLCCGVLCCVALCSLCCCDVVFVVVLCSFVRSFVCLLCCVVLRCVRCVVVMLCSCGAAQAHELEMAPINAVCVAREDGGMLTTPNITIQPLRHSHNGGRSHTGGSQQQWGVAVTLGVAATLGRNHTDGRCMLQHVSPWHAPHPHPSAGELVRCWSLAQPEFNSTVLNSQCTAWHLSTCGVPDTSTWVPPLRR